MILLRASFFALEQTSAIKTIPAQQYPNAVRDVKRLGAENVMTA
jgi:hypothetical protein